MISRYILILLGVISLVWIGYVGVKLVDTNEEFSPSSFFGFNDAEIIVINRIDEVSLEENIFSISQNSYDLFKRISKFIKNGNTVYLSKKQDHFLIYNKDKWKSKEIVELFQKANINIEKINNSSFRVNDFQLDFRNEVFHVYTQNVQFPKMKNDNWLSFDHKASASIIEFKSNAKTFEIKDVYFNKNSSIDYISKGNSKQLGRQVDDQDLFSSALPKNIDSYHFYEKDYYSNLDNVYKKGPMHYWIESGFVELKYKNELLILTDFSDSKDPFLLLNEIQQEESDGGSESSTFFKNIQLTNDFPVNKEDGFYIYKMDNFIILSSSKSICNDFLMSSKNIENDTSVFYIKSLPRKVSERLISSGNNYSKTIYKNKVIETVLN
jgi:hypothetical protein